MATTQDASQAFAELCRIVARLRQECPWDRAQTPGSLKPYLLAETYEALAALDEGDPQKLKDELGDLLAQVVFQAQMAAEADQFTIGDVIEAIAAKLVRRHPHVFGDASAETPQEVVVHWEEMKRAERGEQASALEGVPEAMPALALAREIQERAERAGFRWRTDEDALQKLAEEARELAEAQGPEEQREELGDILFVLVSYARRLGLDPEEALRMATQRFRRRFRALEGLARSRRLELAALSAEDLEGLWRETKGHQF